MEREVRTSSGAQAPGGTTVGGRAMRESSLGGSLLRREVIGLALSAVALLTAFAVGAQEATGGGQADDKPTAATAASQVTTAANLLKSIQNMHDQALKAQAEAADRGTTRAQECIGDIVRQMSISLKLAQKYGGEIEALGKTELSVPANAEAVDRTYAKLASVYETFESYFGQLKGCGGPSSSAVIDGAALVQKEKPAGGASTNPTGSGGSTTTTMSDLAVSAENSKVGSPQALGDDSGGNP